MMRSATDFLPSVHDHVHEFGEQVTSVLGIGQNRAFGACVLLDII